MSAFYNREAPKTGSNDMQDNEQYMHNATAMARASSAESATTTTTSTGVPGSSSSHDPQPPGSHGQPTARHERQYVLGPDGKYHCNWNGCDDQAKEFSRKSAFTKHMDKHELPYLCPQPGCSKTFASMGVLERHRGEVHRTGKHASRAFHCGWRMCDPRRVVDGVHVGKEFARNDNMMDHRRRVHRSLLQEVVKEKAISQGLPAPPQSTDRKALTRAEQHLTEENLVRIAQLERQPSHGEIVEFAETLPDFQPRQIEQYEQLRAADSNQPEQQPLGFLPAQQQPLGILPPRPDQAVQRKRKRNDAPADDNEDEITRLKQANMQLIAAAKQREQQLIAYRQQGRAMMERISTLEKQIAALSGGATLRGQGFECFGGWIGWPKYWLGRPAGESGVYGQGNNGQGSISQGNIGPGNIGHNNIGQCSIGQGSIGQGNIGPGNIGQGSIGQGNISQGNISQGSINLGNFNLDNVDFDNVGHNNIGEGSTDQGNIDLGNIGHKSTSQGSVGPGSNGQGLSDGPEFSFNDALPTVPELPAGPELHGSGDPTSEPFPGQISDQAGQENTSNESGMISNEPDHQQPAHDNPSQTPVSQNLFDENLFDQNFFDQNFFDQIYGQNPVEHNGETHDAPIN
ncbi:hypothetical protein GGR52DRAFT_585745 [Hypoxylon sp. FL1284]|nr:hypothetical protein GGR52DRAFT_585745 [Hypoxylon sp. FL1284]